MMNTGVLLVLLASLCSVAWCTVPKVTNRLQFKSGTDPLAMLDATINFLSFTKLDDCIDDSVQWQCEMFEQLQSTCKIEAILDSRGHQLAMTITQWASFFARQNPKSAQEGLQLVRRVLCSFLSASSQSPFTKRALYQLAVEELRLLYKDKHTAHLLNCDSLVDAVMVSMMKIQLKLGNDLRPFLHAFMSVQDELLITVSIKALQNELKTMVETVELCRLVEVKAGDEAARKMVSTALNMPTNCSYSRLYSSGTFDLLPADHSYKDRKEAFKRNKLTLYLTTDAIIQQLDGMEFLGDYGVSAVSLIFNLLARAQNVACEEMQTWVYTQLTAL